MDQFKAILTSVGVPEDKINEIAALTPEQLKEFKPDEIAGLINTGVKTKLVNDPTFYEGLTIDKLPKDLITKVESGQYERFINEVSTVAKKLGLKEGEDFTKEEARKASSFIESIAQKYLGKHASTESVKKLQNDLLAALQEKETLQGSMQTKIDEALNGERASTATQMERLVSIQKLSSIDGLKVKPGFVVDSILNLIKSVATLKLDPQTLQFSIKQKANPELDIIEGSKVLTFDDLMKKILTENDFLTKEVEDPNKKKEGKTTVIVEGEAVIPSYILEKMGK